jgi:DNA-binding protein Alba
MEEDFIVKVGKKNVWSYVTACITYFNSGGSRVIIRGRGSSAFMVAEVANALRNSFMKNLIYDHVSIVEDEIDMGNKKVLVPVLEVIVSLPESK